MKKVRYLGLWLVGLVALASAPGALAQTEAEEAALSQRPLTPAEISRREADCALPTDGEELADVPPGIRAIKIELFDQYFIGVFVFDSTIKNKVVKATEVYPELPMGGIGARDICTSAVIGAMPAHPTKMKSLVMTWRLRPGVDLAADYPTAAAQIRQNDHLLQISGYSFALIEIAHATEANAIVSKLAKWDRVKTDGVYIVTKDKLYVPLRD